MTATKIINKALAANVPLWEEDGRLRYRGTPPALAKLGPEINAHEPELLEALRAQKRRDARAAEDLRKYFEERVLESDGGLLGVREAVSITAAYARDAGYTWVALRMAMSSYPKLLAAVQGKALPVSIEAVLAEACKGVPGIDAATFKSLLSPDNVEDVMGGHISVQTLNTYAQILAAGLVRVIRTAVM